MYLRTRRLIHRFLLRPLLRRVVELTVVRGDRLDRRGPAVVVANHNSHLDTAVLLASFPTGRLDHVRPVAAADYFLRNRLLAWFTTRIVGILPLDRHSRGDADPLLGATQALAAGSTLVMFPEGTRGEPGVFGDLKSGVARLARHRPSVPVVPVWLDGCDRAMPKGSRLTHPVRCTVTVGRPLFIRPDESTAEFLIRLRSAMVELGTDLAEAA
ncbi:MAG: 1-acyl-sn-glycerol-3-phosphate acyltransferase [Acidimicrobiia bacterium]|nr:1-acyl-sn-glycerol-3-phosphate acyltransferase [Acidimicrobiia bacterium]